MKSRNHTINKFAKFSLIVFCIILIVLSTCNISAAQPNEEMEMLLMYYEEKDLVISPTRNPKPVSQVAEDITVITSKEIQNMNAHTVAEVLNRITGLFINFNQDFGSTSLIFSQGSEEWHVLVLLDGIPWNFLSSGAAETNSIPVGIIKRIEVIKGPASSAWGSSLGGVINIITKPTGNTARPSGSVRASYGDRDTQDHRTEVSGNVGSVGYYLYGGCQNSDESRQNSDNTISSRNFNNYSVYAKISAPILDKVNFGLSIGYSEPEMGLGDFPSVGLTAEALSRTAFGTAFIDASLTKELKFNISFYQFDQKNVQHTNILQAGDSNGDLYLGQIFDENTIGTRAKLVWTHGIHTAVTGVDIDHGNLDQTLDAGPVLQYRGVPATSFTNPDITKKAFYANDTIVIDRWSITPGIRYDYNSITDSFLSPSLGITYKLREDSIIRASIARGFTIPPLSWTSGGGLFLEPNHELEAEKVWSYQAGFESTAARYFWLKATVFRHDLENTIASIECDSDNSTFTNKGKTKRQGIEFEIETTPIYNLSLAAGYAFVHLKLDDDSSARNIYTYNVGLKYDDLKSFNAQMFGHYIWWDVDESFAAKYDDFVWDLNLNKKIYSDENINADIFFTAHNIFDGVQYRTGDNINPGRWIEGGIRLNF